MKAAMALAACVVAAGPASAAVFEVGNGGAVSVRSSSAAVAWIDVVGDEDDAVAVPDEAVTTVVEPVVPSVYSATIRDVATRYHVSPYLLAALVRQESGWRVGAVSGRGAVGLAQLMPGTARGLGVDAADPAANLAGGARYLRLLLDRFDGDVERALAAYNAGPARVDRARGVPAIAETRAYVSAILARLQPAPLTPAPLTTASLVR